MPKPKQSEKHRRLLARRRMMYRMRHLKGRHVHLMFLDDPIVQGGGASTPAQRRTVKRHYRKIMGLVKVAHGTLAWASVPRRCGA